MGFVALTGLAYASALSAPFAYDDIPAIQQNPTIRTLLPPSWLVPPANTPVSGRPVVNGSFALNYAINDALGIEQSPAPAAPGETVGYHVLNVFLHLATGLLLFGIIRRTTERFGPEQRGLTPEAIAGIATLLWLVHPIQSEALNYLTQRTELLVSLFYAGTMYGALRAWDAASSGDRRRWYALALASSALGMASKEVMVTAPMMVLLYDRAFRAQSWNELRPRIPFYAGLFATSLIAVATVVTGQRSESVGFHHGVAWYEYLWAQAWAVARYLWLVVWPSGLTFDYGEYAPTGWRSIPGVILLAPAAIAAAYAWFKGRRLVAAFLAAWFFLLIAPSSSVVPIKTEMAAERRIYLASAAIFVAIALGLDALARRRGVVAARAVAGVVTAVLVITTFARGRTYADTETLYRDNIAKAPRNARAHVSLGLTLMQQGPARAAEAKESFRQALAIDGENVVAWRSLGLLESLRGNWSEAAAAYTEVLRRRPDNLDAVDGLGRAYLQLGQPDVARPYVDRMGTRDVELLWMLGDLLVQQGRGKEALPYLEGAATSGRPPALGLAVLGMAYAQAGHRADAVKASAYAVAAAGDTAEVYVVAARAMTVASNTPLALKYLERALSLDPDSERAREALAEVRRAR